MKVFGVGLVGLLLNIVEPVNRHGSVEDCGPYYEEAELKRAY